MRIHPPCAITPRLRPGIQVAGAWLSIEYAGKDERGANCFKWAVDVPELGDFEGGQLYGWGGVQGALDDLVSFLDAAGDWVKEPFPDPLDGEPPFPLALSEWASKHSHELQLARCALQETPGLIVEGEA